MRLSIEQGKQNICGLISDSQDLVHPQVPYLSADAPFPLPQNIGYATEPEVFGLLEWRGARHITQILDKDDVVLLSRNADKYALESRLIRYYQRKLLFQLDKL